MHEFGMVDEFIEQLVARCKKESHRLTSVIRVGYGPGLVEDSLKQAFEVHTAGTPLERTRFEFIKKRIPIPCQCGTFLEEEAQEHDFPYAICDECQHVTPIPGFNVLELIDAV